MNALRRSFPDTPPPEFLGTAFEHFIVGETRAWLSYHQSLNTLSWWRSQSGFEVDLLIGDRTAIEIKATHLVTDKHLKGLRALREDLPDVRSIVVSQDPRPRITADRIEIMPWQTYLDALEGGTIT